ncbi:two-component system response regulator [Candidatus Woesearchaeota archaeon]|mgnify:CR=1 FL=1|nr:MAG: two-component system response regulator [Candidatus Woesearchaeota archaeon]
MKILIADDSAFMRNIIKNILTQNGVSEVIEAVDGQDAINKYGEINPDLVFLDIMMPNKTGLEALKEIKGSNPEAKVVMCTSVGQEKVVEEAVESGAEDFVTKPFKPEDIQEVLSKFQS